MSMGPILLWMLWLPVGTNTVVLPYRVDPEEPRLSRDWGGVRSSLEEKGLRIDFEYVGELFGNTTGGRATGVEAHGVADFSAELDFEPLFDLSGMRAKVHVLAPNGGSPSDERVGDGLGVSGIDAPSGVRLQNLWVELGDEERLRVRVGQQIVDDEFLVTPGSELFLHGAAAFPANLSPNAPTWPFASTAATFRFAPLEWLAWQGGAFHADPDGVDDRTNPDGTRFGWDASETLWISEVVVQPAGPDSRALWKAGGWWDTGDVVDPRDDDRTRGHTYGLFVAMDQPLWREAAGSDEGVDLVAQLGFSPDDRSVIERDARVALVYQGLFSGRPDDRAGIGWFHPTVSGERRRALPGVRTESFAELTYEAAITPGWSLQGSVQYIRNPGGADGADLDDALVLGIRATLAF